MMTKDEFFSTVLEEVQRFTEDTGKAPNELRVGSRWQSAYEEAIKDRLLMLKPDPYGKRKHWWFMDMRVFYEHWTCGVSWSEETEQILNDRNSPVAMAGAR